MDRNTKQINLAKLNSRFFVEVLTLPVIAEPPLRATMHVQFSSHNTTRLACPFSFFIPYSTENVPVSYTFHLQMVPFLHTHKRVLDHFSTSVTEQIAKQEVEASNVIRAGAPNHGFLLNTLESFFRLSRVLL